MEVRAGPSITSSDPDERKLARRLRIERREKAIAWAKLGKNDEEEEVVIAKTPVELQVHMFHNREVFLVLSTSTTTFI